MKTSPSPEAIGSVLLGIAEDVVHVFEREVGRPATLAERIHLTAVTVEQAGPPLLRVFTPPA